VVVTEGRKEGQCEARTTCKKGDLYEGKKEGLCEGRKEGRRDFMKEGL
jgi:hypothetical protein